MQKLLTKVFLDGLKAPATGRIEVGDTSARGLTFRLSASGAKSWSFRFRDPASGRVTRQTFSGDLELKQARAAALEARALVARGQNPVEEKRKARQESKTRTFDSLADRYLTEHARRHKRTADADERMLRLHVRPAWGSRRFDKIGRADVIALCEAVVTEGKPTQANRVQALVSKIFSFALDADLIASHPCARLKKRSKEIKRTRTLSDAEILLFWNSIGEPPNSKRIGLALRFVLLTGARVTEVAGARLSEFDRLDDTGPINWTIPEYRSKNGKAHVVPLSMLAGNVALELIDLGRLRARANASDYLLPSPTGRNEAIDGHALSVAMTRFAGTMDKRKAGNDRGTASQTWSANKPTAHDLRRTMATRMSAAGVPAEDVSACLNHMRKGVTATHYDHYDRAKEKRRAFELWAELVETITAGSAIQSP